MTDPEIPTDLAQQLAAQGAVAHVPNIAELLAQIQNLQARVVQMETERGVPSDPVGGAVKDLVNHVTARSAQYPNVDSSELMDALKSLPEEVEHITSDHVSLIRLHVETLLQNHSWARHELSYLTDLGLNLAKAVLTKAVA